MRVLIKGREREVTQKVGQALILLGKAKAVAPEQDEKESEPVKARTYKRRDVVAETEVKAVRDWPKPKQ